MKKEIRSKVIQYIIDTYGLTRSAAIGIVDYELPHYDAILMCIDEDNAKERSHSIEGIAKHIMKNDEGKYQIKPVY
jgi:hypothetical protein